MKVYALCIWIFLSEIRGSSTDKIETDGYTGKNIEVSCQHSWASTNTKYFCRDACEDVLVSSDQSSNGRFSLKDFGNGTFTVTITELQESDSGIYWCGVGRVGPDTYHEVNVTVFKDITPTITELHTTQPLPTPTRQPESQFATSSRTSGSSTPDDITQSPSMSVSSVSVNISLYAVGGLIAVVILVCGPVAVCHYRKIIKTLAGLVPVPATPVDHNEDTAEEDTNVYENDVQDTRSSKQMKSKMLKSKVPKSHSHSVYENVELKPGQSDVIYGNL
ncbi:putative CMRF35-like molecule 4 [Triplophysa rosa]|uniref:CMRF35-like molecule 4 n=1 Tax=Triplophysa rosa TaxID=992332 RepID=A0A9W8C7R4_TRIRA|nr:putative CMRF35-like molecule 4 [Triplophysa rosa]